MVYTCGGQRTALWSQFSLCTFMRVPGSSQVSRLAQQVLSLLSNLAGPRPNHSLLFGWFETEVSLCSLAGLELVSGCPGA